MSFTVKKASKEPSVLDNIGNVDYKSLNGSTNDYTANNLNQYSDIDGTNLTYDADGNMLTKGNWSYAWNGENRLISASNATQVLSFTYDYVGRRISKTVDGDETTFVYNGFNLIQESSSVETNHYVWGLDLSGSMQGAGGVGGLLSVAEDDGAVYIPVADANGNITGYVDENTNVVAVYVFDAFGGILSSSGSKVDDFKFRFSSKYQDSETSFNYYGYRYYDAEMGRWLNRDPIGEMGGINLYASGYNNYLDNYDYQGLCIPLLIEAGYLYGPVISDKSIQIINGVLVVVTSFTVVITVEQTWQNYKDECEQCVKDSLSKVKDVIRKTWEKFSSRPKPQPKPKGPGRGDPQPHHPKPENTPPEQEPWGPRKPWYPKPKHPPIPTENWEPGMGGPSF